MKKFDHEFINKSKRRLEYLHFIISEKLFNFLSLKSKKVEEFSNLQFTRVPYLMKKVLSYQFLNKLSERAYLERKFKVANDLREISLNKRLKVNSKDIIFHLKQSQNFIEESMDYISLTGIENLGFIFLNDRFGQKKLLKIHDYNSPWNKEIHFYSQVLANIKPLKEIVTNTELHTVMIRGKKIQLIEFDFLLLEDIDYSKFHRLEYPYKLLSSLSSNIFDSETSKYIGIDKIDKKYLIKLYRMIKVNIISAVKDKDFLRTIKLKEFIMQIIHNIDSIKAADYCLNHGDFDFGGIGGYGNKFIINDKVVLLDWSDLKFVIKGLNYIMLMRRHKSVNELLYEIENSSITLNLSKTLKSVIILNVIVDYSALLKQTKNAMILNDIIFLLNSL